MPLGDREQLRQAVGFGAVQTGELDHSQISQSDAPTTPSTVMTVLLILPVLLPPVTG